MKKKLEADRDQAWAGRMGVGWRPGGVRPFCSGLFPLAAHFLITAFCLSPHQPLVSALRCFALRRRRTVLRASLAANAVPASLPRAATAYGATLAAGT